MGIYSINQINARPNAAERAHSCPKTRWNAIRRTYLVPKGIDLDNNQAEQIIQGLIVLATVGWSAWQKLRQRDKVTTAAATGIVP